MGKDISWQIAILSWQNRRQNNQVEIVVVYIVVLTNCSEKIRTIIYGNVNLTIDWSDPKYNSIIF